MAGPPRGFSCPPILCRTGSCVRRSTACRCDAPATEPRPPLTLVSHLGCDGPIVLMVGAMRDEVDWAALDADLARVVAGHPEWQGLHGAGDGVGWVEEGHGGGGRR